MWQFPPGQIEGGLETVSLLKWRGLDVKTKWSAKPVWWWLAPIFPSQPSRFHPQPKQAIKRSGSVSNLRFSRILLFGIGCVLMLTAVSAPASAQIVVKNDDVTLRFGFQGQLWADWTQDSSGAQNYQQNFYMRRARIILCGVDQQVVKNALQQFGIESKRRDAGLIIAIEGDAGRLALGQRHGAIRVAD